MFQAVIGRTAELASIDRFLSRANDGLSGLVLQGAPGIGKTTLWEAAGAEAANRCFSILRSRPAAGEAGLALAALGDLFGGVSLRTVRALPDPQRRAMEVALLRADPTGDPPDQRAVSVATAGLLSRLAERSGPLLIALDDVQWLDESSAAILAFALRRLQDRPIGVVASLRAVDEPADPLDMERAMPPGRFERLVVGPLSLAALHRLLTERLNRSFPRMVLIRIEEASGGNPFYALEIARALIRSGARVVPGERLPVPATLGALMGERIRALPARTQSVLVPVAAALEPTLDVLGRAGVPDPAKALRPAVRDGVVAVEGRIVRFAHPLLAQAVLASTDPVSLRGIHGALAQTSTSAEARARHLGLAANGPDETAAAALEAAAVLARARGASLDAASLYEQASTLTPQELADRATERATLAAECLFVDISDFPDADATLDRALSRARPGPARANALSLRAIVWYYFGRYAEAVGLCEQALAETGDDRILRAKVLVRLAFLCQLDQERALALNEEAVSILEGAGEGVDPALLADALLMRATSDLFLVRGLHIRDIARAERLITSDPHSWWRDSAYGTALGLARATDDLDRAIAMTDEVIRREADRGSESPFDKVLLSGIHCLRGNWAAARALADAGQEAYAREGEGGWPAWSLRGVALVAAHDGRVEEARRLASQGLELATEAGDLVTAEMHRHILGFVALSLGEFHRADHELSEAATLAERSGVRHPGRFKIDGDRVEAALAVGDVERAGRIVEFLEHSGRVAPTPWVLSVAARCRGLLDAANGDLEGAARALERAMAEHEHLPMPFERARTLLVKGQVHRRRKEKRLADRALRDALRIFEDLGAPIWADRARAELGRIGLRPRAPTELTETEWRVAELAARGLSTREIAEAAFLAPKTVENVLGRVYRKLGIRSRAQLGARIPARPKAGQDAERSGPARGESATHR